MSALPPPVPPPPVPPPDYSLPLVLSPAKVARDLWAVVPVAWTPWQRGLMYVVVAWLIAVAWYLQLGLWVFGWWVIVPVVMIRRGQMRREYEARRR